MYVIHPSHMFIIGLDNGLLHIYHYTIIETNDGSPYISMC